MWFLSKVPFVMDYKHTLDTRVYNERIRNKVLRSDIRTFQRIIYSVSFNLLERSFQLGPTRATECGR